MAAAVRGAGRGKPPVAGFQGALTPFQSLQSAA